MVASISKGGMPTFGDPTQMYWYAQWATGQAGNYIAQLGQASAALVAPTINPVFPSASAAPALAVDALPATQQIIWTAPAAPAIFSGNIDVGSYLPPAFSQNPPTLTFPTPPMPPTATVPDSPAVNLNYTYPTLSVTLPAPPSLLSLQTYTFGGVNMPTLDPTVPTLSIVAPSVIPYNPGAGYTSALLTELKATLLDRIVNGTNTGLPPAAEQALWDRAREREYRQMADGLADLDKMEAMGFAFPPGVYVDARVKMQTEMQNTTAGLSRDIAAKQAELIHDDILKALDTSVQLESRLMDYTNAVEQRIFESCKYQTEAGIALYNAQVQAYTAYLDAYKLKVQIYEAEIRGQEALVQVYKTEIEAEQVKAQVNTALVEQYKVTADVAALNVQIYKVES